MYLLFHGPFLCLRLSSSSHRETEVCPGPSRGWTQGLPAPGTTKLSSTSPVHPVSLAFLGPEERPEVSVCSPQIQDVLEVSVECWGRLYSIRCLIKLKVPSFGSHLPPSTCITVQK